MSAQLKKPKCKRCGRCCKTNTLLEDSHRILKVLRFFILLLKAPKFIFKKPDCPFLTYENGLSKCSQYNRRPNFCRDYFCEKCFY